MNTEQFNRIVEDGLERTRRVLIQKAEVYARGDRLSNFKTAGVTWGQSPEHCLYGMVLKHWVKFTDMVADIDNYENEGLPSIEQLEETTGDIRNYLHLFEALVRERIERSKQKGEH